MTNPVDHSEEAPLDPAVQRVQRRLKRLILISGLTLGLGMFAVLLAIVYRLATYEPKVRPAVVAGTAVPTLKRSDLGVPDGARLVGTALDGDRLALSYEVGTGTLVIVLDLASKTMVDRLMVAGE